VTGICSLPVKHIRSLYYKEAGIEVPFYDGRRLIRKLIRKEDFHPLLFSDLMKDYMDVVLTAAEEIVIKGRVKAAMPGIAILSGSRNE